MKKQFKVVELSSLSRNNGVWKEGGKEELKNRRKNTFEEQLNMKGRKEGLL